MSYPTELETELAQGEMGARRALWVARRTLRDDVGLQRTAAITLRDSLAVVVTRNVGWIATPTVRDGTADAPEQQPEPPAALLGRYATDAFLGRGAEAELWRASRRTDRREITLKVYFPGIRPDPAVLTAITGRPVEHVPRMYEYGEAHDRFFEAQEYLPGGSLRDQIHFGPLDALSARHLLREMADALDAMHARDRYGIPILHGDIKPENILLRSIDPLDYVLADFGVSILVEREGVVQPRRRGHTPHYSAPECLADQPGLKSDYWSLGMTLLEALAGSHPFADLSPVEVRHRIADNWHPTFSESITPAWRELLSGLLHHDSQRRWGGVEVQRWLRHETGMEPRLPVSETDAAAFAVDFSSARDLAIHLAHHWDEMAQQLQDAAAPAWLDAQVTALVPHMDLARLRAEPVSSDLRLMRLIYRLAADLPPLWKIWMVDAPDVAGLCAQAAAGDMAMQAVVRDLHTQNVLGDIGGLTARTELSRLAAEWNAAWRSFVVLRECLIRMAGPVDRLHSDDVMLALLFLAVLHGVSARFRESQLSLRLCCPWSVPLLARQDEDIAAALLASLLLPSCEHGHTEHFSETCEFEQGDTVTATQAFQFGWNPPVVAFSAIHAPILFRICEQSVSVGNQIRLAWNVSGAAWVYLLGDGRVSAIGEMVREEGAAAQFALLAVNLTGATLYRLPTIDVPVLRLHEQLALCKEMVHGATDSAADLNPLQILRTQHPWRFDALSSDNLNPQMTHGRLLHQDDLPSEAQLVGEREFSSHKLSAVDLPIQQQWH